MIKLSSLFKLTNISYSLFILLYLLSYDVSLNIGNIRFLISIVCLVISTFTSFIYVSEYKINKIKILFLLAVIISIFVYIPVMNKDIFNYYDNRSYSIKNLVFILNIFSMVYYINKTNQKDKIFNIIYYIIGIFIIFKYFTNFDGFEGIKQIANIFSKSLRYRNNYGLWHANTVSALCFITLTISTVIRNNKSNLIRGSINIINFFLFIVLISTASRTALICISLFYILKFVFNRYLNMREKMVKSFIIIMSCFIFGIGIFIISNNLTNNSINDFLSYSNRSHNFTYNLPIFLNSYKTQLGLGAANIYLDQFNYYKFLPIDNSYLSILFSYGYIGVLGLIVVLIIILSNIICRLKKRNNISYIISLFISFIFYSSYEDILFNEALIVSFVFWIQILIFITENKEEEFII